MKAGEEYIHKMDNTRYMKLIKYLGRDIWRIDVWYNQKYTPWSRTTGSGRNILQDFRKIGA